MRWRKTTLLRESASFWIKPLGERWTPWPNLFQRQNLSSSDERQRVRRVANELAAMMNAANSWRVDVAAVFSQLGYISLPEAVSEGVYYKRKLETEIKEIVKRLPEETATIIDKIPGLEEVGEILSKIGVQHRFEEDDPEGLSALRHPFLGWPWISISTKSKDTQRA